MSRELPSENRAKPWAMRRRRNAKALLALLARLSTRRRRKLVFHATSLSHSRTTEYELNNIITQICSTNGRHRTAWTRERLSAGSNLSDAASCKAFRANGDVKRRKTMSPAMELHRRVSKAIRGTCGHEVQGQVTLHLRQVQKALTWA